MVSSKVTSLFTFGPLASYNAGQRLNIAVEGPNNETISLLMLSKSGKNECTIQKVNQVITMPQGGKTRRNRKPIKRGSKCKCSCDKKESAPRIEQKEYRTIGCGSDCVCPDQKTLESNKTETVTHEESGSAERSILSIKSDGKKEKKVKAKKSKSGTKVKKVKPPKEKQPKKKSEKKKPEKKKNEKKKSKKKVFSDEDIEIRTVSFTGGGGPRRWVPDTKSGKPYKQFMRTMQFYYAYLPIDSEIGKDLMNGDHHSENGEIRYPAIFCMPSKNCSSKLKKSGLRKFLKTRDHKKMSLHHRQQFLKEDLYYFNKIDTREDIYYLNQTSMRFESKRFSIEALNSETLVPTQENVNSLPSSLESSKSVSTLQENPDPPAPIQSSSQVNSKTSILQENLNSGSGALLPPVRSCIPCPRSNNIKYSSRQSSTRRDIFNVCKLIIKEHYRSRQKNRSI